MCHERTLVPDRRTPLLVIRHAGRFDGLVSSHEFVPCPRTATNLRRTASASARCQVDAKGVLAEPLCQSSAASGVGAPAPSGPPFTPPDAPPRQGGWLASTTALRAAARAAGRTRFRADRSCCRAPHSSRAPAPVIIVCVLLQFNWEDVKEDKQGQNYLGHSVKAAHGRCGRAWAFLSACPATSCRPYALPLALVPPCVPPPQ